MAKPWREGAPGRPPMKLFLSSGAHLLPVHVPFLLISISKKLRIELTDRLLFRFQLQSGTHVRLLLITRNVLKTELTLEAHERQVGTCDQNLMRLIACENY